MCVIFASTKDFVAKFEDLLIEYEEKYGQVPDQAYIPFDMFDKLALVIKEDPGLDLDSSWKFYLSMVRYHYIDIHGVRCFRTYVSDIAFSSPSRPEYGMYQGKP